MTSAPATAPQYVQTDWQTREFDAGGAAPAVLATGTLVFDQPTLDAIYTAAQAAGVKLTFSSTPPPGYPGVATAVPSSLKWQPNTRYPAGWLVVNPSGQIVAANADFVSGTSYSAGNWTVVNDTGAGDGAVASVAGKTGAVTLVKGDVGLGNVDNTSDASKPVSTAQQTALNAKMDATKAAVMATGLAPADIGAATVAAVNAAKVQPQQRASADQLSQYTNGGAFPTGTNTLTQSRFRKRSAIGGRAVELVYQTVAGLGEQTAPNGDGSAWTISASLEYPAGTFYRAYAADGVSTAVTIIPNGGVAKLYVPAVDIPAGVDYWIRTRVACAATGGLLATAAPDGLGEWTTTGAASTDYTMTNTGAPATNTSVGYGPACVTFLPFAATPCVAIGGDSISEGKGDNHLSGGNTNLSAGGWAARALSADGQTGRPSPLIPHVNMSITGEQVANWSAASKRRARLRVFEDAGCNNYWVLLGANDIAGSSLATIQAQLLSLWTTYSHRGRVFGFTLPPVGNSSTDLYATTGNQTAGTNNAVRVALNQWLRAGAPIDSATLAAVAVGTSGALLAGVYSGGVFVPGSSSHPAFQICDVGSTVESATDSGLWRVNGTANAYAYDGTHPDTLGHQAMALKAYTECVPNLVVGVGHVQSLVVVA